MQDEELINMLREHTRCSYSHAFGALVRLREQGDSFKSQVQHPLAPTKATDFEKQCQIRLFRASCPTRALTKPPHDDGAMRVHCFLTANKDWGRSSFVFKRMKADLYWRSHIYAGVAITDIEYPELDEVLGMSLSHTVTLDGLEQRGRKQLKLRKGVLKFIPEPEVIQKYNDKVQFLMPVRYAVYLLKGLSEWDVMARTAPAEKNRCILSSDNFVLIMKRPENDD